MDWARPRILGDVRVGDNCIIGANAVVTKNVEPNSVVGGVPARVIKQLSPGALDVVNSQIDVMGGS